MALAAGDDLDRAAAALREARPTAVNLAWAVDRVAAAARAAPSEGDAAIAARTEAERIHAEEAAASAAIAAAGAELLADAGTILTHCNTGALATGGRGSALAVDPRRWPRRNRPCACSRPRPARSCRAPA